jgi:hypothetical protein
MVRSAGLAVSLVAVSALVLACNANYTATPAPATPGAPAAPECKMGSDGNQTCGYNCKLGSDGHWYCASKPEGQCALNASGSWTCP